MQHIYTCLLYVYFNLLDLFVLTAKASFNADLFVLKLALASSKLLSTHNPTAILTATATTATIETTKIIANYHSCIPLAFESNLKRPIKPVSLLLLLSSYYTTQNNKCQVFDDTKIVLFSNDKIRLLTSSLNNNINLVCENLSLYKEKNSLLVIYI